MASNKVRYAQTVEHLTMLDIAFITLNKPFINALCHPYCKVENASPK